MLNQKHKVFIFASYLSPANIMYFFWCLLSPISVSNQSLDVCLYDLWILYEVLEKSRSPMPPLHSARGWVPWRSDSTWLAGAPWMGQLYLEQVRYSKEAWSGRAEFSMKQGWQWFFFLLNELVIFPCKLRLCIYASLLTIWPSRQHVNKQFTLCIGYIVF